jgi:hypothetical protein
MSPSAFFHHPRRGRAHDNDGTLAAVVIAILFALLALISFAVDQSISLPSQPEAPPDLQAPR